MCAFDSRGGKEPTLDCYDIRKPCLYYPDEVFPNKGNYFFFPGVHMYPIIPIMSISAFF